MLLDRIDDRPYGTVKLCVRLNELDEHTISLLQHLSLDDVNRNRFQQIWRSLLRHLGERSMKKIAHPSFSDV